MDFLSIFYIHQKIFDYRKCFVLSQHHVPQMQMIFDIILPYKSKFCNIKKMPIKFDIFRLARRKGLEPLTLWFVATHSIQLS